MDTSWWLALVAVVLLALVATLVDGWGRRGHGGRRTSDRSHSPSRSQSSPQSQPLSQPQSRPGPAEVWWVRVPQDDGPAGAGDRPCLVLAVRGERVVVVKITTRYRDEERAGVIPLPPGVVGDARGRAGFLETGELREVPVGDFRRRAGVVDPLVWEQVRDLPG
ncbi:type II toxin-antitoxin system PemK/MazF family toxin [Streptomyces bluensis]|uniref:type II toxin-antitoxin system PemK/MazF family toxin n=1 Tax=Streptomyces bluensis TaxID=33897 RepID=UPI001677030B|nr:type II toxin-antitoxin system PemK/MazF family toxin [Streptomyces bluensis]